MSDVATAWAKAQDCPSRNAKDTLKALASWCDAEGEGWALVSVLALEMQCKERTVQRGLAELKAAGLIIDTGERKKHRGRFVPIYQLPLETGHANTMRRMRAEALAREAADEALDAAATGDTGDTPRRVTRGDTGCQPCHPTGDVDVTPTGDTGDTQIGNGNSQGLTPLACVRASEADQGSGAEGQAPGPAGRDGLHLTEAMAAWARKAPERVAPALVRRAWASAMERSGIGPAALAAAVTACVARDPDFARARALNLDRWLDQDRFRAWMVEADAPGQVVRAGWAGPAEVRDLVVAVMGEAAARSYIDPAGWDGERRAVRARTGFALGKLLETVAGPLAAMDVRLEQGGAAHG